MAKERHEPPPTSNYAMAILVVGILLVGGLVAWALTRTVDVAPTPAATQEAPVDVTTAPLPTQTAARNTPPVTLTSPPITTTPTPPVPAVAEHDNTADKKSIPRIPAEDLRAKLKRGEVTVIDVRDQASYALAHIPGALHIQFASLEGMIDTVPKGKPIVLYCTWPNEESSAGAALILKGRGIQNVSALSGGLHAWENLGYPVDRAAK